MDVNDWFWPLVCVWLWWKCGQFTCWLFRYIEKRDYCPIALNKNGDLDIEAKFILFLFSVIVLPGMILQWFCTALYRYHVSGIKKK